MDNTDVNTTEALRHPCGCLEWPPGTIEHQCAEYPLRSGPGPGKDSGFNTKTFESGAQRQSLDEVRHDLISPYGLRRLAMTYAEGAAKYNDHNWRQGMPFSSLLNHVLNHINEYLNGERGEDHLAHAAWGLFAVMEQEVTHPEQDDLYFVPDEDVPSAEAPSTFGDAPGIRVGACSNPKCPRCWG